MAASTPIALTGTTAGTGTNICVPAAEYTIVATGITTVAKN